MNQSSSGLDMRCLMKNDGARNVMDHNCHPVHATAGSEINAYHRFEGAQSRRIFRCLTRNISAANSTYGTVVLVWTKPSTEREHLRSALGLQSFCHDNLKIDWQKQHEVYIGFEYRDWASATIPEEIATQLKLVKGQERFDSFIKTSEKSIKLYSPLDKMVRIRKGEKTVNKPHRLTLG